MKLPAALARTTGVALAVVFGIFFDLLGFVLNVVLAAAVMLARPVRALRGRLGKSSRQAARVLTPTRALAVVVAGAAVLLALSQFADYRGVSIGVDDYAAVETVAPAPEIERDETGSAHSYALVPLAVVVLALLAAALNGRWRLCRLIALAGVAAIAVGLLVDRPAGLDPGEAEVAFQGVRASLLGGFYAQIFSGLLLTVSALLLGRELRLAEVPRPARHEPGRSRRRRALRRPPKAEGARA